jgi:hypothetical protein
VSASVRSWAGDRLPLITSIFTKGISDKVRHYKSHVSKSTAAGWAESDLGRTLIYRDLDNGQWAFSSFRGPLLHQLQMLIPY